MPVAGDQVRARLRHWPRSVAADPRQFLESALPAALLMLDAARCTFAWEDPEEPWVVIASASGSAFEWREEGSSLDDVCESLGREAQLSVKVEGEVVNGCLFVSGQPDGEWVEPLVDVIGMLLAHDMDHLVSSRVASRQAVHEERLRVARDLHDGLLQSFTGVVLHLEMLHDMIEKSPADARSLITNIQGLIMADQRDLRSYVEQLRPRRRIDVPFDFLSRLNELQARFETQWGIPITIDRETVDPLVAQSLGPETFRLIQEAVTNAAKHGSASEIRVRLTTRESRIWIDVSDDGSGFPFHGRRTLKEIRESGVGPSMLAERVAALNGDLAVESSGSGAKVQISIPLGFSGG
jgi:signal transduction histidine kinase